MPELKREFGLEEKSSRLFPDILPMILGIILHIVGQYVDLPELAPEPILT
jgi:hypothetical protein